MQSLVSAQTPFFRNLVILVVEMYGDQRLLLCSASSMEMMDRYRVSASENTIP